LGEGVRDGAGVVDVGFHDHRVRVVELYVGGLMSEGDFGKTAGSSDHGV
jgi:hypothetical protein